MSLFQRIRRYRVYRRLILSYVCTIIVSITMVSAILYSLFSARAVKEIDNSSKQMLSQVSYTANVVYKQIEDVMSQLLIENDINAYMYAEDDNKITDYKAYLIISKVQSVYRFIGDISLYNFENGQYVDTLALPRDVKAAAPSHMQFVNFYPRVARKSDENPYHLLSFRIVPDWNPATQTPRSALVIDLNESYIQNTIRGIDSSVKNANTFVMDARGVILSHSDSDYFMDDFSGKPYIQHILKSKTNKGSFVQAIDHRKDLVTYVRSSALDWYFVTVRPYNQVLSNVYRLRNWTFLVAFLLVLIGILFSLFLSGNMYNPVRSLMDRVMEASGSEPGKESFQDRDEYALLSNVFMNTIQSTQKLQTTLNRSEQVARSGSLLTLLLGTDRTTLSKIKQQWKERLEGPFFKIILIQIDHYHAHRDTLSAYDREVMHFAIMNIAQEILSGGFETEAAMTDEEVILLLQSGKKEGNDRLQLALSEAQDVIQSYFKITVSAGMGDWCGNIEEIKDSYTSAREYLKYRLFLGVNSIFDAERVQRFHDRHAPYPQVLERKIIDAVKACSWKDAEAGIKEFIEYLSNCNYSQAMQYSHFIFLSIVKEFETKMDWMEAEKSDFSLLFRRVQHAETLGDIQMLLTDAGRQIMGEIQSFKQHLSTTRNERLVEEVKRITEEKYAEPDFSLEVVAERVGLSAGHLGKLFKSQTNSAFHDYVTMIRINHAKSLLDNSYDSIAEIGAKVGISGASYFSTVFKRHVGLSPTQYRDNQLSQN